MYEHVRMEFKIHFLDNNGAYRCHASYYIIIISFVIASAASSISHFCVLLCQRKTILVHVHMHESVSAIFLAPNDLLTLSLLQSLSSSLFRDGS